MAEHLKPDVAELRTNSLELAFARTGDPNTHGLPAWPRYAAGSDVLMGFTASGEAVAQRDPWL